MHTLKQPNLPVTELAAPACLAELATLPDRQAVLQQRVRSATCPGHCCEMAVLCVCCEIAESPDTASGVPSSGPVANRASGSAFWFAVGVLHACKQLFKQLQVRSAACISFF